MKTAMGVSIWKSFKTCSTAVGTIEQAMRCVHVCVRARPPARARARPRERVDVVGSRMSARLDPGVKRA
jgi:hypothetical protein